MEQSERLKTCFSTHHYFYDSNELLRKKSFDAQVNGIALELFNAF